jgi:lysophospholipase L1-like esterase
MPELETAIELVDSLLRQGDVAGAKIVSEAVLVVMADQPDAWRVAARVADIEGDRAALFRSLSQIVALDPADGSSHHRLARLLRDAGQASQAITAFDAAIASASPSTDMYADFAQLLEEQGDILRAVSVYRQLLTHQPDHAAAQQALDRLAGDIEKAEKRFVHYVGHLDAELRFPAPFIGFTGRPLGTHEEGSFDEMGFRNLAPPSRAKPPGEIRIFVLGDSTIFGGASNAQTIPGRLETALHDTGLTEARVYNYGVVSSCAMQMVALLFFKLVDLTPDLVLVCNGPNDLSSPITYDPRPGTPYNFYVVEELYTRFFDPRRNAQAPSSLSYSDLLAGLAARQTHLRRSIQWKTAAWEERVAEAYIDSAEKLRQVASASGVDVALLFAPCIAMREAAAAENWGAHRPDFLDYLRRQYRRIGAALFPDGSDIAAADPNFTKYDMSHLFWDVPGRLFDDYIHFNDRGRAILVARMVKIVTERLAARRC